MLLNPSASRGGAGGGASRSVALQRIVLHMEDPDDVSTRLYAVAALQA